VVGRQGVAGAPYRPARLGARSIYFSTAQHPRPAISILLPEAAAYGTRIQCQHQGPLRLEQRLGDPFAPSLHRSIVAFQALDVRIGLGARPAVSLPTDSYLVTLCAALERVAWCRWCG